MSRIVPNLPARAAIWLLIALLGGLTPAALAAEDGKGRRPYRVLVLHSFSHGVFRTDGLSRGITEQFNKSPRPIQEIVEYLDVSILEKSPEYGAYLDGKRDSIRALIASEPPDAILLTDWKAKDFWVQNYQTFGPDLPVVFCGVGDSLPDDLRVLKRVTCVLERPGFSEAMLEASRLFPEAGKVLVVGDKGLHSQTVREMLHKDLSNLSPRLAVEYLDDMEISAIEKRLSQLGPDWVVYVVGRPEQNGKVMLQSEASPRISAASPVPVFITWASWMGYGPVGGKIIVPEEQGKAAAKLVLDMLDAGSSSGVPPRIEANGRFMFDHNALVRFNIDETRLPLGSMVINRPVSILDSYRHLVWTYVAIMVLLAATCGILALHVASRRRLQNKLGEQVNFVGSLMEAMPTPVFYKGVDGKYLGCNPAFEDFMGMTREQLIGHTVYDLYPEPEADIYKAKDDALFAAGPVQIYEYEKVTPSGPRQIRFHKALYHGADGKTAGLVGVIADITDLRRAERELENTRNYLQAIIDSSPSAMLCMDTEGRITHANARARSSCVLAPGRDSAFNLPCVGDLSAQVRASISEGKLVSMPRRISQEGGRTKVEDVIIYPLASLGLSEAVVRIDDVSEQHRLQEVLIQSEKMMSVGGLAAGMAHEINNPLGGVMQSAQVIANRLRPELEVNRRAAELAGCSMDHVASYLRLREIYPLLENLRDSAKRAAGIVSNMLEFSRRSTSAWLPADLNDIVEKSLSLCQQDYNFSKHYDFKKINIVKELDPDSPFVPCSPSQIQQVLFNLMRNAAQAMSQGQTPEPVLVLRTRVEGDWAVIEVEDNGPGMEESVRRKVFEPFFTTKSPGLGTGLGLSVSYFIVRENHRGEFDVVSAPGEGARFILRLPLHPKKERR
ncbi:PAS domain-containing protein [Fundidesulfovibrio agrisoli]|uniref:PAS domain-containing protein n=1 Tax=Fundidesulfovibrio agrisoli TaxID=2922717 RepID=UPI001FADB455|nr:PAS domain-containing protein [Fundidesulfovibrio agrisoli]